MLLRIDRKATKDKDDDGVRYIYLDKSRTGMIKVKPITLRLQSNTRRFEPYIEPAGINSQEGKKKRTGGDSGASRGISGYQLDRD